MSYFIPDLETARTIAIFVGAIGGTIGAIGTTINIIDKFKKPKLKLKICKAEAWIARQDSPSYSKGTILKNGRWLAIKVDGILTAINGDVFLLGAKLVYRKPRGNYATDGFTQEVAKLYPYQAEGLGTRTVGRWKAFFYSSRTRSVSIRDLKLEKNCQKSFSIFQYFVEPGSDESELPKRKIVENLSLISFSTWYLQVQFNSNKSIQKKLKIDIVDNPDLTGFLIKELDI